MKKVLIFAIVLLGIVLVMPKGYCQGLTDREWQIYNEWEAIELLMPDNISKEAYQLEGQKFMAKYGLTKETSDDIWNRVDDIPLTDREWDISYEIDDRAYEKGGDKYSKENEIRACREVASKYGISFAEACGIWERSWDWWIGGR
ncbi:MAG: hypothetical protein ABIH01_01400 [Candidatus Omnitrophota bacterium]